MRVVGYLCYALIYGFIHLMRLIGWWRIRAIGLDRLPPRAQSGMIIAMNHIHWLDIPVIGAMLPFSYRLSWLAKAELFANPIFAWWLRQMLVIPIKRGARDIAALDTSAQALRDGAVLLIFPEGHRSRTGVLQKGRGGAIRLAATAGVPIVPVAVTGTEHRFGGLLSRKPISISFGEPFIPQLNAAGKLPPEQMDRDTTEMMERIALMLPDAMRGEYAQPAALAENLKERP